MCIKINKIGKQEVGIWRVQKRFPRYEVPIWRLWPNIRSLPLIVAEKNVQRMSPLKLWKPKIKMLDLSWSIVLVRYNILLYPRFPKGEGGILFYLCPSVLPSVQDIFRRIFLSNWMAEIWCPKTLPTIWGTYMKLVTKYQISAIYSCWEKCAYMFNVYKNQLSWQYRGKRFWTHRIPTSCLPILLIFIHI
jgi:hypothetical protein